MSQGHNDMLTAVGFEPVPPLDPNTNALSTAPHASLDFYWTQHIQFKSFQQQKESYFYHKRSIVYSHVAGLTVVGEHLSDVEECQRHQSVADPVDSG